MAKLDDRVSRGALTSWATAAYDLSQPARTPESAASFACENMMEMRTSGKGMLSISAVRSVAEVSHHLR